MVGAGEPWRTDGPDGASPSPSKVLIRGKDATVASRELRNSTRELLARVQAGEEITITVHGRPAAVLAPLRGRPRWVGRDEFIAREVDRPLDVASLPDELAVSVITVGELRAGVLVANDVETHDRRLSTLAAALSLEPLPIDGEVADAWMRLRVSLREAGRRMPVNDSWVAATALAHDVPVVTQDRDHVAVAGLRIVAV